MTWCIRKVCPACFLKLVGPMSTKSAVPELRSDERCALCNGPAGMILSSGLIGAIPYRLWIEGAEQAREGDDERKPRLADLARERGIAIEDVPWLVKDFDALYRAAERLVGAETAAEDIEFRRQLRAQLDRLAPAFEQIQALKAQLARTRG